MSSLIARALRPVAAETQARARTVLHVSFGAEADFHVHMWLPFVAAVDPTFVIVVRSTGLFLRLRRHHRHLPVVLLRSGRDVAEFIGGAPALRVVLYTSNSGNVLDFLRHEELRHVFIGHGDSDKVASINRFFRLYDENWVSGQAQIDRLRESGNIGPGQLLRPVGRPVVRSLLESGEVSTDVVVGIMPTWEGPYDGQNYSSAGLLPDVAAAAIAATGARAVVKVHPWTGKRDAGLADAEDRLTDRVEAAGLEVELLARDVPAHEVMRHASLLIADVSSITVDFLLTGRPIFVYLPSHLAERVRSGTVPLTEYAYTFATIAELRTQLEAVVGGDDPLASSRARAREYLVDVEATADGRFEQYLEELLR